MSTELPSDQNTSAALQLSSEQFDSTFAPHDSSTDQESQIYKWYHHFIAGEFAGMAGMAVAFPFDTMKTLVQQSTNPYSKQLSMWRQVSQCFSSPKSLLSIYRGSLFPFFGMGIVYSVTFGINGTCQNFCLEYLSPSTTNINSNRSSNMNLNDSNNNAATGINIRDLTMIECITCGGISGIGSTLTFTPMDRIKTWSQIHGTHTIESTKYLYKNFGIKNGLLYGIKPTAVREIPQFAIYWPIYEISSNIVYISKYWNEKNYCNQSVTSLIKNACGGRLVNDKTKEFSQFNIFLCGAVTGMGTWIFTYPLDVIKTRFQASAPNTYQSILHCAKMTYKEIGLQGYFKGLTPTIVRAFGLHSSIFLCYENILHAMKKID